MEIKSSLPTVTISVLTYNSAKYVIETLDSIKSQSYPNIILQVCDDCSTDNTTALCRKWIDVNRSRFVKATIIQPEHNTGVTANCNRAWSHCETDYCKDIAGDDILLPNCIEDNINYALAHPEALIIFSRLEVLPCKKGANKAAKKEHEAFAQSFHYSFFNLNQEEQVEALKKENPLYAPTAFYKVKKLLALGLRHDERIPDIEDYPKWINASRMGIHFHFIDIPTIGYRFHEGSISHAASYSERYQKSLRLIQQYYDTYSEPKKEVDIKLLCTQLDHLRKKQHKHLIIIRILTLTSLVLLLLLFLSIVYR